MSSNHRDYVPQNPAQFRFFMENLLTHVDSHVGVDPPLWPLVPYDRFETLAARFADFKTAHDRHMANPTPANRKAREEAKAACVSELRGFVNQFLRFAPVTNADRIEMGVPVHDTILTDHTVVTEKVDYVIHLRGIRELLIDFWIQGESHKAKPHGYDGAVIVWGILDAPPASTDDLIHHTMASRTPFPLHFEETDRGKTVYITAAWQNERGIIGQWAEFKSAIVP